MAQAKKPTRTTSASKVPRTTRTATRKKSTTKSWSPNSNRLRITVIGIAFVSLFAIAGVYYLLSTKAAGGWLSGAASPYAANGSFAAWRGEPLGIGGTWVNSNDGQLGWYTIKPGAEWGSWSGPIDIAMGAIENTKGESWSAAGNGAYDARWRQSAINLRAAWGDRPQGNLYIRFAHEMNGNWYPWSVPRGQENDFKKAWIRWSNIMDQEVPDAKKVISFNKNSSPNYAYSRDLWPGKQYVDIYSIDWYNVYPWCNSDACFASEFNKRESNGDPVGIEAHRQEAEKLGMPFAISEWSNSAPTYASQGGGGGESPALMTYMNNWMRAHGGSGAGQLVYEVLFNLWNRYAIYGAEAQQPQTAARYRELSWGDGGLSTPTPTPTPTPVPAPTPTTTATPVINQTGNLVNGKTFLSNIGDSTTETGYPLRNINDRNEATRWISQAQDNAFISVDLGNSYKLSKVSILWAGDTTRNYEVQVSNDNTNWQSIAGGTTTNKTPQLIDHTTFTASNTTGRYLRVWAKDRWNTSYGHSIWELGVYGSIATNGRVSQTNNLLSGKTFSSTVADSTRESGNPLRNINDGNEQTRWISDTRDGGYITTDLGANYRLSTISILWAGNTTRNYIVQTSTDNRKWTSVVTSKTTNTTPQLINHTGLTSTARYIRIQLKDRWNSSYGHSIFEIGVYGTKQ